MLPDSIYTEVWEMKNTLQWQEGDLWLSEDRWEDRKGSIIKGHGMFGWKDGKRFSNKWSMKERSS
jgi:hypothetical protein